MYQSKKTRDFSYNTENVVHSRYGDPPPNWYPGEKICPFSGQHCANWKCMAWTQETQEAEGYCTMISRFSV